MCPALPRAFRSSVEGLLKAMTCYFLPYWTGSDPLSRWPIHIKFAFSTCAAFNFWPCSAWFDFAAQLYPNYKAPIESEYFMYDVQSHVHKYNGRNVFYLLARHKRLSRTIYLPWTWCDVSSKLFFFSRPTLFVCLDRREHWSSLSVNNVARNLGQFRWWVARMRPCVAQRSAKLCIESNAEFVCETIRGCV